MLKNPKAITLTLALAAASTAVAAILHFACIFIEAPAYRFLGAGEAIAQMAARGHWYPPCIASVMGMLLSSWSAYALSGAGLIYRLPLTQHALIVIAIILIGRALAFPFLNPVFPGNSQAFWLVTSGISLVIGLAFLIGAISLWRKS